MKSTIVLCVIATIALVECTPCEYIPTVANFDPKKFSGAWVSRLESAEPRLPCLHYTVVPNSDGTSACTFLPYGITANAKPANSSDLDQGFDLSAPLALMNGGKWRIVDTDYTSYAAHFTCKEADGVSYHSATIWSRPDNIVSYKTVKKLKELFSKYGISTSTLFPIYPQTPDPWCKETAEVIPTGLEIVKQFSDKVEALVKSTV